MDAADLVTGLGGVTIIAIAAGGSHAYARDNNGQIWAWGSNTHGQLGNSPDGLRDSDVPILVLAAGGGALTGVTAVKGGGDHGIAIRTGGTVWTWGDNTLGQLGRLNFGYATSVVEVVLP